MRRASAKLWQITKKPLLPLFCRKNLYICTMAKNYFKSYIWLLETFQSRGPQTLKEIKDLWMRSAINEEGKELAFEWGYQQAVRDAELVEVTDAGYIIAFGDNIYNYK